MNVSSLDRISHINMKILCLSPLLARLNYIQILKLAVLVTSQEIYDIINPTGVFCNLEHVASPSVELHVRFLNAIGYSPEKEDRANRLLPMEIQLGWLRDTGFVEVDCYYIHTVNIYRFHQERLHPDETYKSGGLLA